MMNYAFQNPYMNPQARLEQLINQYPQYFNQGIQQGITPQQGYRTVLVSNIDEANATPVDSSGTIFFYNRSQNEVYLKQIDATGSAPLQKFILASTVTSEKPVKSVSYDKDFKTLNEKIDGLQSSFDSYIQSKPEVVETKGGKSAKS